MNNARDSDPWDDDWRTDPSNPYRWGAVQKSYSETNDTTAKPAKKHANTLRVTDGEPIPVDKWADKWADQFDTTDTDPTADFDTDHRDVHSLPPPRDPDVDHEPLDDLDRQYCAMCRGDALRAKHAAAMAKKAPPTTAPAEGE